MIKAYKSQLLFYEAKFLQSTYYVHYTFGVLRFSLHKTIKNIVINQNISLCLKLNNWHYLCIRLHGTIVSHKYSLSNLIHMNRLKSMSKTWMNVRSVPDLIIHYDYKAKLNRNSNHFTYFSRKHPWVLSGCFLLWHHQRVIVYILCKL